MEFFWFIGEAQVVVSSSGWWNSSLLLLALSLGHLAEPVAELPAQKAVKDIGHSRQKGKNNVS